MTQSTPPNGPQRRRSDDVVGRRDVDKALARRALMAERVMPVVAIVCLVCLLVSGVISVTVLGNQKKLDEAQRSASRALKTLQANDVRRQGSLRGLCEREQIIKDDANNLSFGLYQALDGLKDAPGVGNTLGRLARSMRYSPPTNCDEAIRNSATYIPPPSVPFSSVAPCYSAANPRPSKGCP